MNSRCFDRTGKPSVVTLLGPRAGALPSIKAQLLSGPAKKYWLSVGSLEPRKNYSTLLDAFELYMAQSNDPLPLKIAGGSGWNSDLIKLRIRDMEQKGIVQYLGYVPDNELPALYSAAEALIFPSWYEGFGLPVLEAMAFGCPVISSNRTSLPEVGSQAVTYIDPSDPLQIAAAMLKLETDLDLRQNMIQGGLLQAASFSWENTARQTLSFYEEVLTGCRLSPA
jgi:glycosyltransferase involved in cell wall biosynthesis